NRSWTGRDGERREETLFIDVTVWDRQAENCCQYLRKGSPVHVEGYLKTDTWDDKTTGEKRSKVRVQAERVQFLDSRRGDGGAPAMGDEEFDAAPMPPRDSAPRRGGGSGGQGDPRNANGPGGRSSYPAAAPPRSQPGADRGAGEDEDIPF